MKTRIVLLLSLFMLVGSHQCLAHFGMVIPSDSMPDDQTRSISVDLSFSHPFEQLGMPLATPKKAGVMFNGDVTPLELKPTEIMDFPSFSAEYRFKRPGSYTFFMEPQPYWEPEEDVFIIHYTKATVPVWNDDEGWDQLIGLPTEIAPLSKPFGLYAGNVFQGQVLVDGKPVPHAEVEVEFYNQNGTFTAPSELMITQTVKADQNGVFSYAAPWAGWWGFAALNEAPYTLTFEGEDKGVEMGAVLWVEFVEPKKK